MIVKRRPHLPLPTYTAAKDLPNRRLVILNRHHDVNILFLSMISSFTGSRRAPDDRWRKEGTRSGERERKARSGWDPPERGTSASDREERLLKEAPDGQNTSLQMCLSLWTPGQRPLTAKRRAKVCRPGTPTTLDGDFSIFRCLPANAW